MILLLGLILRVIGLESRSVQYDDTFSIFLSARSLPEILRGTAADTMPPLYYFLLHFWMLLGQSAWFIRLLSVILSLTAVFLLYRLVACWFGRAAAGWAAFLAAISPLLIYHGQDVRMYALLVVCQLGYLWFFTRIWQGEALITNVSQGWKPRAKKTKPWKSPLWPRFFSRGLPALGNRWRENSFPYQTVLAS